MDADTQVVALCGSLRDESKTRVALTEALDAAREAGAATELIDLRTVDLPAYDPDDPTPAAAERLKDTVDAADAILLGTPNYHGSYTGTLKTALDYLGRDEFAGKTVGLLEVAGGSHPGAPLVHLRGVCRTLNAWTLPREVAIPNASSSVGAGGITDEDVASRVRDLGSDLVAYAGVEEYPAVAESGTDQARSD